MRNVTRLPKPQSLVRNGTKWTRELLRQIELSQETGSIVKDSYYEKYNKPDIRDTLKNMYSGCCCYCESKIGLVDYPHIEHRKPKRSKVGIPPIPFPESTYDWENLHLACTKCNISKGTKFDNMDPILDAVTDIPIEEHFNYRIGMESDLLWFPKTNRGLTTQKHADLNRTELSKARYDIFREVYNLLSEVKKYPRSPGNEIVLAELEKKTHGESSYGSVISFLLNNR